jgi:N-acetylglutamate synthase-like GNAT family acetyltransferase
MKDLYEIRSLDNTYFKQILNLILPIQQVEFNVPVTLEGQPDLFDIETYYTATGGGFWGAIHQGELIGSIALISIGHQSGAIRKMFVRKEFRGKEPGIARQLFHVLVNHCKTHNIHHLYLGTVDTLKAAHRFYERNGFQRISKEALPLYFPAMMGENVYYNLQLAAVL